MNTKNGVTGVTIKVKGKEFLMSLKEARELYCSLGELLDGQESEPEWLRRNWKPLTGKPHSYEDMRGPEESLSDYIEDAHDTSGESA